MCSKPFNLFVFFKKGGQLLQHEVVTDHGTEFRPVRTRLVVRTNLACGATQWRMRRQDLDMPMRFWVRYVTSEQSFVRGKNTHVLHSCHRLCPLTATSLCWPVSWIQWVRHHPLGTIPLWSKWNNTENAYFYLCTFVKLLITNGNGCLAISVMGWNKLWKAATGITSTLLSTT